MGNILDKQDKSLAQKMPGAKTVHTKKDVYNWVPVNRPGIFMLIDKQQLNIDGRYQRQPVSNGKVLAIAREWNWILFEALSVVRRKDGTCWVVEGGHRTRAAFYRDDVQELPCMVFDIDSLEDEAKAFVCTNTMISNVSAADRHKASVCAGEPEAAAIQELLDEFDYVVVKGGSVARNAIMCIGVVRLMVSQDAELARQVFRFMHELDRDEPISGKVMGGLFALARRFKSHNIIDTYGDKIKAFGQRGLIVKINQYCAEMGKGGHIMAAKALLRDVVNHKKHNKLQWAADEKVS